MVRQTVKIEQRLAALERNQEKRIVMVKARKRALDAVVARKQLEIDNLRATLANQPAELKVAT